MAGLPRRRPGRRDAHQEAVARRLELLGAELDVVRGAPTPAPDDATHTRVRPGREPDVGVLPLPLPGTIPAPGRHAARGRLTLGIAQLPVVSLVVLGGLAVAAWWLLGGEPAEVVAPQASPAGELVSVPAAPSGDRSPSSSVASGSVTVDVAGKVRRPGIAVLEAGSRVVDALETAGGARKGVDLTGLNLARVLVDGEQILVGVTPPSGVAATMTGGTSPVAALVNLNTADQVALESLPEVGPVTAQAIAAWRDEHGAFTSVDQLLDVDGIGEATLAKLVPYVTL